MSRWDAMPADDVGLRRVIAHYYRKDNKITSDQPREIPERWGNGKGLAAYYLVFAELLKVQV
jgi:DNA-3-methyladenine glycosylase II